MENLSKKDLCEINAGGCKEIYSTFWSTIVKFATGGDDKAVKAAGIIATQQFEYLELFFSNAINSVTGFFSNMLNFSKS